jgi:O-antigen/teichoic acid export membrane protein
MFKKIAFSFSLYSLTAVICAALSILLLPILTKHLSEKDYGATALFSTFVMIISPIIGLSSGGYFWIEFFKKDSTLTKQALVFSSYFWITIFTTLCITLLIFILYPLIKEISFFNLLFLLLIPATGLITLIGEETKNYYVNKKKPLTYLFYSVSITLIEIGLSYYFVIYVFKNWEGRIYAWLISLLVQFIFTICIFAVKESYLKFIFSKTDFQKLILFGYPLIFHQLGKFVVNQSDRIFISKMISLDEAGIYSIGYQVGSMILLPISAFSNFFNPYIFERLSDLNQQKKVEIVKSSYVFISVIFICFFLVVILSPFFFELFIDSKFKHGLVYVPWVALSYVFWGIYLVFSAIIFYKEKTKFLGLLSLFNIVLNCLLNVILINYFGAIGAAYATAISFLVVMIFTVLYSNKLIALPWLSFNKIKY